MLTEFKKELIAIETIKVVSQQLREISETVNPRQLKEYSATFLDSLSEDWLEGINLRSWTHGLNTSLGQSFFENVAHLLCNGTKKEFTSKKGSLLRLSQSQKLRIGKIITDFH
ncbi:MAG: TdeIII family type II restriction endonuclease [Pyrinomonadaceae bacterium]